MPNRVIREGILTSERINSLSWPAECFFMRLMLKADDFGRFDARESILRASLYPLKISQVREADITRWMAECQNAGLIALYEVEGKRYLEVPKFDQRLRAKTSKWPTPDGHMSVTCQSSALGIGDGGENRETKARAPAGAGSEVVGQIYEAYPLKRARPEAEKAIKKALIKHSPEFLLAQTRAYAKARGGDLNYVPNPATWFNQERFNDPPSTWIRSNGKEEKPKIGRDPDELMSETAWQRKHGHN